MRQTGPPKRPQRSEPKLLTNKNSPLLQNTGSDGNSKEIAPRKPANNALLLQIPFTIFDADTV